MPRDQDTQAAGDIAPHAASKALGSSVLLWYDFFSQGPLRAALGVLKVGAIMAKKKGRMQELFGIGLSGSKAPMTIDQAVDAILDPVNIKRPKKGKKPKPKK